MSQETFHRPPRDYPEPVPSEPVVIAAPPLVPTSVFGGAAQIMLPALGSVTLVVFAIIMNSVLFLYLAGAMAIVSVLMGLGMRMSQKRGTARRAREERRRYRKHLAERERRLGEITDIQRQFFGRLYPDVTRLWAQVLKRRNLWERRPSDPDFLSVSLGRGAVPLACPLKLDSGANPLVDHDPDLMREAERVKARFSELRGQPVVIDLADLGVVAITGPRDRGRTIVRSVVAQLAAYRAPQDLHVVTYFGADDAADWEWLKWLPHASAGAGGPGLLVASSSAELSLLLERHVQPRIEQLRRMAETSTGIPMELAAPSLVIVVDGFTPDSDLRELPLFRELLRRGAELKVSMLLLVDNRDDEPSGVTARIAIPEHGRVTFEELGPQPRRHPNITPDDVDLDMIDALVRPLARLRLEELGGDRNLAEDVRLLELIGARTADAIEPAHAWRSRPRREQLRVPIGVRPDGEPVELDLKESADDGMGPHGLIVGATGSGKSELLRTIVASLAVAHSPDDLAFVFVDFKGGAAFAELAGLPHSAGLITNLQSDLSLIDRMREALAGEVQRRQALLSEAGNLDDVRAYRTRREADPALEPMPYLLVIVDEFGELLANRPEFTDLFVRMGAQGRSLGIHLLLASQRLDEGKLRGLDSHLRYRIGLRTFSPVDSKTVLGTNDAYRLPDWPGMAYLKVEDVIYEQFKGALVSSPHREPDEDQPPAPTIEPFVPVSAAAAAPAPAADGDDDRSGRPTELELMVGRLRSAQPGAVHQVWLPPLEELLPLDAVLEDPPWWRSGSEPAADLRVPVGVVDVPAEQRKEPLVLDFAGMAGHLAVVGAPQTGKTTVLRSLLAGFVCTTTPAEAQFYCIDLSGMLRPLAAAPHVGDVVDKLDRDRVRQAVRQVKAEIEDREHFFRMNAIDSMADLRAQRRRAGFPGDEGFGDLFLVIDNYGAFVREFETLREEVEAIAQTGLNYGVHVVITAQRWNDIRPALRETIGTRLELRLNDPADSEFGARLAATVPTDMPGRGLTQAKRLFQTALPRIDGKAGAEGLHEALAELAAEAARNWDGASAQPVRTLPLTVAAEPRDGEAVRGLPIGIEEFRLDPIGLDLVSDDPHFVILGDSESGKTNLFRALIDAVGSAYRPDEAQVVMLDYRRTLIDAADRPNVFDYAFTPETATAALERLAGTLRQRMPGADATREELISGPSWSGPRYFVMIDDYDLAAGPPGSAAASAFNPLVQLLPYGRDIGLHVVLARRVGGAVRQSYDPLFQALVELGSSGIVMSGSPQEGPVLGGQRAVPLPPGRGYLIRRGQRPTMVQTYHAERGTMPGDASPQTQREASR